MRRGVVSWATLSLVCAMVLLAAPRLATQGATLSIVDAAPQGPTAQLQDANEIRVIFSEPMVALGRIPSNPTPESIIDHARDQGAVPLVRHDRPALLARSGLRAARLDALHRAHRRRCHERRRPAARHAVHVLVRHTDGEARLAAVVPARRPFRSARHPRSQVQSTCAPGRRPCAHRCPLRRSSMGCADADPGGARAPRVVRCRGPATVRCQGRVGAPGCEPAGCDPDAARPRLEHEDVPRRRRSGGARNNGRAGSRRVAARDDRHTDHRRAGARTSAAAAIVRCRTRRAVLRHRISVHGRLHALVVQRDRAYRRHLGRAICDGAASARPDEAGRGHAGPSCAHRSANDTRSIAGAGYRRRWLRSTAARERVSLSAAVHVSGGRRPDPRLSMAVDRAQLARHGLHQLRGRPWCVGNRRRAAAAFLQPQLQRRPSVAGEAGACRSDAAHPRAREERIPGRSRPAPARYAGCRSHPTRSSHTASTCARCFRRAARDSSGRA